MFLYGSTEIARYNGSCNNKLLKKESVIKLKRQNPRGKIA